MDHCSAFWNAYRKRVRAQYAASFAEMATSAGFNRVIKAAAREASREFCKYLGFSEQAISIPPRERLIRWQALDGRACSGKLDVFAEANSDRSLIVAYEHEELATPMGKGWGLEFAKLCGIEARLRVLSSYFKSGKGRSFEESLEGLLARLSRGNLWVPGDFLLVFGPEYCRRDQTQEWLAFSLERDPNSVLSLRKLNGIPLRPFQVVLGVDPGSEE